MLERSIDELNANIHDYVSPHAERVAEHFDAEGAAMKEVREAHMYSIGDRLPVPPPLVPAYLMRRLTQLHQAFRAGLEHIFADRMKGSWARLANELRLDEPSRRYLRESRRPRWANIGRPDVVIQGDTIAMVEPNVGTSCGGMPDADILGRMFEQAPVIGDFLRSVGAVRNDAVKPVADLIEQKLKHQGFPPEGLVLVVERAEELSDPSYYHCAMLARELRRHGIRADVAAIEDLETSADAVTFGGDKVGVLYRMCGEQPDPVGAYPAFAPVIDAAAKGTVSLVDDLGDQIAGNKTILAILSEELDAGRLPAEMASRLDTFIPWSRVLEDVQANIDGSAVDLLGWCEAEQLDLVLKPGSGFQGRGVTIGCEVEPAQWRSMIEIAVKSSEPWLVQRLVRTEPTRISISRNGSLAGEDNFVDYGYYAIGNSIAAAGIRKSAPFGNLSRRIKPPVFGPLFFV